MIVMKFGGTSNRDASAMAGVLDIITHHLAERPLVVISAIAGATNDFESTARAAACGEADRAREILSSLHGRHRAMLRGLVGDASRAGDVESAFEVYEQELDRLVQGVSILRELTPRTMDAFCSYGERFSSRLVCAGLQERGVNAVWVDAREFMVTDASFGRALPLMNEVAARCARVVVPLVERLQVPVTQGFIGVTTSGVSTTMGRESSDFTASIIGAAVGAERVQIWTDVDGILTADPRMVADARKVRQMTFEEAFELSFFGAKVLHPHTMLPLLDRNIPVEIRNSRREDGTGTLISGRPASGPGPAAVKSISFTEDVTVFAVSPRRRGNQYLFWEEVFSVLSRSGIDAKNMTASEHRIAFTVSGVPDPSELERQLGEFGEVTVLGGQSGLCVVGTGLRHSMTLAEEVFQALAGIRISLIAYGASDLNLTVVVDHSALRDALGRLHGALFGSREADFDVPLS